MQTTAAYIHRAEGPSPSAVRGFLIFVRFFGFFFTVLVVTFFFRVIVTSLRFNQKVCAHLVIPQTFSQKTIIMQILYQILEKIIYSISEGYNDLTLFGRQYLPSLSKRPKARTRKNL